MYCCVDELHFNYQTLLSGVIKERIVLMNRIFASLAGLNCDKDGVARCFAILHGLYMQAFCIHLHQLHNFWNL